MEARENILFFQIFLAPCRNVYQNVLILIWVTHPFVFYDNAFPHGDDTLFQWCGPCRMMAPVVEKLAEEMAGEAVIGKLNVDDCEEIAMKYGVMNIPTIILFKNGQEINRVIGAQTKEVLEKLVRS